MGASVSQTGLSQAEPVTRLGPSGFDPSRWPQDDIDADMFRDCETDDDFFDCHMGPDGFCGAAGSEDCEFECPFRRDQRRGLL